MIDLHIHSTYSDGELSPIEIIDKAKSNNIKFLSISDHDSISAYTTELFSYAEKNNIKLIPAVEMSTRYLGVGFHVLGYNFDLTDKNLSNCLNKLQNARVDYLCSVSKKLNTLGYIVNVEKLKNLPSVTKAHISQDVINNVKNKNLLLKTFNHIPSKGEFIETIMNEGCPAFVEKFGITPIEASKIIKEANGIVILAHPVSYIYEDNITIDQIKSLINQMQADGIESNYIYVDKNNNVINDSDFWNKFAVNNQLKTTIGSDYHRTDNIRPEIGFINTDLKLSLEQINKIINDLQTKKPQ